MKVYNDGLEEDRNAENILHISKRSVFSNK